MKVKKTQDPHYARVVGSKLIINTDNDGFKSYMVERERSQKMMQAVSEVDSLKSELAELKHVLSSLISQRFNENK